MKQFSTAPSFLKHTRRGALLLGLSGLAAGAFGQSFAPVSNYFVGAGSLPEGLALGDVNKDGRLDIVTSNTGTNSAGVLLGQTGGFSAVSTYVSTPSNSTPWDVKLGDVNGDGWLDIVLPDNDTNSVGVMLAGANGGFAAVNSYGMGTSRATKDIAVGDINGDGRLDIAAVIYFWSGNNFEHGFGIRLGQAGGGFAPTIAYSTGAYSFPSDLALRDVNGDNRLDIVIALQAPGTVGVLLGLASGGFGPMSSYATGPASAAPFGLTLGDVNGDGQLDIVASLGCMDEVSVLLGQAGGGFAAARTYTTGGYCTLQVALGDVNGDGRLDIISSDSFSNSVGVLLGQTGGFGPMSSYATGMGSTPSSVTTADVNGDGRLDIIVASTGLNSIGVFLNTGTYTPLATAPALASADLILYPNPAHDAFTVQLPAAWGAAPVRAELLNALGQVVRRPRIAGSSGRVDTSGLPPGLYTLRLQAGNTALARRVVLE